MRRIGIAIGALVILLGAFSFAAPGLRISLDRLVMTPAGFYAIAAERVVVGLMLVFAAAASRAPRTVRLLGLVLIIAGLATPWFGVARAEAVLNVFADSGAWLLRLDAAVGIALGGFLVYVFGAPARRTA
ncbi:MAG TPA: hypothetical protein VGH34_00620 [Vicinamibacterales bacterium]